MAKDQDLFNRKEFVIPNKVVAATNPVLPALTSPAPAALNLNAIAFKPSSQKTEVGGVVAP